MRNLFRPALRLDLDALKTEEIAVSVIDCPYLDEVKVTVPPELALLIVRKASRLAADFEERALDQLTNDALRELRRGTDARVIYRQLCL